MAYAYFEPKKYPEILTKKHWSKSKGIVASVTGGNTGVGQIMTETERYFDGVDWKCFDFKQHIISETSQPEMSHLEKYYAIAEKQLTQIKRVEGSAGRLKRLLIQVARDYAANKLVPKAATSHAEDVRDAAGVFEEEMGPQAIKKYLDSHYEIGKRWVVEEKANVARSSKAIITAIDACTTKSKSVKTRKEFVSFFDNQLEDVRKEYGILNRGVIEFSRENERGWMRFCGRKAIPSDDDGVKEALDDILRVLKGLRETVVAATKL